MGELHLILWSLASHCKWSWKIWNAVLRWWGISWCSCSSVGILMSSWSSLNCHKISGNLWGSMCAATLWSLWCFRNETVFRQQSCSTHEIVASIKVKAFKWSEANDSLLSSGNLFCEWVTNPVSVCCKNVKCRKKNASAWCTPPINTLKLMVDTWRLFYW